VIDPDPFVEKEALPVVKVQPGFVVTVKFNEAQFVELIRALEVVGKPAKWEGGMK